jgi:hypothetical protein
MNMNDDDMATEYDFSKGARGRYAGRFYVDPATPPGTTVILRRALPEHDLQEGDAGRLLAAESDSALRIEFGSGGDAFQLVLRPGDLRLLGSDEILHARRTRAG